MNSVVYEIQPFNEFSLDSCFNEAYLPAYKYLGGQEIHFLMNKFMYFRFKDNYLQISMRKIENERDIEENYGIVSNVYEDERDNIIQFTIDCLSNKKLVICRTFDSYAYNPITKKKTEKGDFHWNLLFGYDLEAKEFDVLAHYTNVAALYYPLKMSFSVLEASYRDGFINSPSSDSIHVLEKKAKPSAANQPRKLFVDRYSKIYDELITSNEALINYLTYLQSCGVGNITQLDVLRFSEIVKYYQRKNYILNEVGITQNITPVLVKHMNLLRTYCIKCIYSPSEKNYAGIISSSIIAIDKIKDLFEIISNSIREGA